MINVEAGQMIRGTGTTLNYDGDVYVLGFTDPPLEGLHIVFDDVVTKRDTFEFYRNGGRCGYMNQQPVSFEVAAELKTIG